MCGPAWQSARGDGTRHHAQSADTIRSISSSTVPRPYRKSRPTLYSLCLLLPFRSMPAGCSAVTPPPGRGPSRLTATRLAPAPVAHSCPSRSASACAVRASSVARPATSSCSCSAIVNDSPSVQAERERDRTAMVWSGSSTGAPCEPALHRAAANLVVARHTGWQPCLGRTRNGAAGCRLRVYIAARRRGASKNFPEPACNEMMTWRLAIGACVVTGDLNFRS